MVVLGMGRSRQSADYPARAISFDLFPWIIKHLSTDRTLLRQASIILLFCAIADLLPGVFMGAAEGLLRTIPGLLIILPPTVGLRGNTFGALAARLGSKLHLGSVEPRVAGNRELRTQITATFFQLMLLSGLIPIVGIIMAGTLGIEIEPLHRLLFISLAAGILSGILMFAISIWITFASFRKGWDPDNVSAPVIATVGDMSTIPLLFLAGWGSGMISGPLLITISYGALLVIFLLVVYNIFRRGTETRKLLVGTLPVAAIAIFISTISGVILSTSFEMLFEGTVFLFLIPAFNSQGGSMGSILGSRLTSAAYLGQDPITLRPNKLGGRSTRTLWVISLLVFTTLAVGGAAFGLMTGVGPPPIARLLLILLAGGTLVTILSSTIAYYTAYASYKVGMDPDNVVIPILTSLMDVVGSGSLIIAIIAVGWAL